jgi:hypothetical protein
VWPLWLPDVDKGADHRKESAQRAEAKNPGTGLEKHGGDGQESEERADLAGPVGLHVDMREKVAHDEVPEQKKRVAAQDDNGEPERKIAGRDQPEGHQHSEEKQLVRDRVEQRAEGAPLVPVPGQVAVQRVGERGDDENRDRPVPPAFDRMARLDRVAIGHHQPDEDRDQDNAENGDPCGPGHRESARKQET